MKRNNIRIAAKAGAISALYALTVCMAFGAETNPPVSRPADGTAISRIEFEARFGKPVCTEAEFSKKFSTIYRIEFTNFLAGLANPMQIAKKVVSLSGAKADGLSEESYYVVVPRVFVESVPSNTLASMLGLQQGDEILEAYWEADSPQGGGGPWEDGLRFRLPIGGLSLWNMKLWSITPGAKLVVKTSQGELSMQGRQVTRYVNALMSQCGLNDPQSDSERLNQKGYDTFANYAFWLPECKNLGARIRTEYEVRTGLNKDKLDQNVNRLTGHFDNGVRESLSDALCKTEIFPGFAFANVHQRICEFVDDPGRMWPYPLACKFHTPLELATVWSAGL
jgi:hypothetical protein